MHRSAHQRPSLQRHRLDACDSTQTVCHLIPLNRRLGLFRHRIQEQDAVGRKPRGALCQIFEGRRKERTRKKNDKAKGHLRRNQTIHQWRFRGALAQTLSASAGFTPDARIAGISPKSSDTPSATANPNATTAQSASRTRRAGLSGGLILRQQTAPPAKRTAFPNPLPSNRAGHSQSSPSAAAAAGLRQSRPGLPSLARARPPAPL